MYSTVVHSPAALRPYLAQTLETTNFTGLGSRYQGKVRDVYTQGDRLILIATDRQSAFDIQWCTIPLKGQVLNQLSNWWFDKVKDVMPTHVIATPDPNVTVAKKLRMVKVEVVVRAYLTGSTSTSVWVSYEKGVRNFCGNPLPDGMRKNQKLQDIIFTPSTKSEGHDESLSPKEMVDRGETTKEEIEQVREKAFALFRRGQEVAAERGLILVDTKYEMGYDADGVLTVGDEVHTPDSSRYWIAATYEERFAKGQEPESLDKEFFRLWLREQGFDPTSLPTEELRRAGYGKPKPAITDDVRLKLASKYINLYERMTREQLMLPPVGSTEERIATALEKYK